MNSEYRFYPQHLHLHSCYEPGASMEGHIYHARALGMRHIWFTDHDIRMGRKPIEFDRFGFVSGLTETDGEGEPRGFKPTTNNSGIIEHFVDPDGTPSMKLSVKSDGEEWCAAEAVLFSNGKSHCTSLLSGVSIEFTYRLLEKKKKDVRLIFDFKLSERPPEGKTAHIIYVVGCTDGLLDNYIEIKEISHSSEWQTACFNLSEDVPERIGGLDNTFDTVTVRLEARKAHSATAYVKDFVKNVKLTRNETRENQKRVAEKYGKKYGVTPFVATEISCAGMHKNLFSTIIPIIDYDEKNFLVSHEEACRYALDNGGVFALNHPFSAFKRMDLSKLDMDAAVRGVAKYFLENSCFGAGLIEVGFPEGRYLPLECHLRLWDILSLGGSFLTGYGCNDAHSINSGWYKGSNFAAFFAVKKAEEPTEKRIVDAMRAGRAYTADPVQITGNISFKTSGGAPMGAVLTRSHEQRERVVFRADKMKRGMTLKWVVNGEVERTVDILDSDFFDETELSASLPINFARAELYGEAGNLLLLTNPIYLVREDMISINIPEERKYGK